MCTCWTIKPETFKIYLINSSFVLLGVRARDEDFTPTHKIVVGNTVSLFYNSFIIFFFKLVIVNHSIHYSFFFYFSKNIMYFEFSEWSINITWRSVCRLPLLLHTCRTSDEWTTSLMNFLIMSFVAWGYNSSFPSCCLKV